MFHFPPRRILVPDDLTPASLRAFKAARFVAEKFRARLELVHCRPPAAPELAAYGPAVERHERRRAEAFLRRRFKGADALHIVSGSAAAVALRLAKDRRSDLIVVGTHGRLGASRAVFGSVAASIMRGARVPVLVVRTAFRPPRHVLAPLREDKDAERGLVAAGVVARALRARLDVLHVVTDPLFGVKPDRLLKTRVGALLPGIRRDTKPEALVRIGRPVAEILRAARGRDLIVMVERSRSPLEDLFAGTTAERVARRATAPVLTIPSGARVSRR
jgi:nucleotide-binding universal stress UspA family protein